jgi:glycosyltransferase involved in cell wall biosynthesis
MTSKNMLNQLVSIVMPTYNHANYISLAVDSVRSQTYTNWELIIVDNFSDDGTLDLIKNYSQDARVKLLQINNDGIVAKSRNMGINNAAGSWVAFLDSDDVWFPNKLQTISTYLNDRSDLIYHHLNVFDENSKVLRRKKIRSRKLDSPILKDLLLNGNTIATSSVVVRKRCLLEIGGMNESKELIGTEDYSTWLRISKTSDRFTLVPKYLGAYRSHSLNLSKQSVSKLPFCAVNEFLPLLTEYERFHLNLNHSYTTIRMKFVDRNFQGLKLELYELIRSGTYLHKLKSIFMLLVLFFTLKWSKS